MDDILDVIDCEGTARWRQRKAVQHPDDLRNLDAVAELERLAPQINALRNSPLSRRLNALFDDEDNVDRHLDMMQAINATVRGVAFSGFYADGKEFLQAIIEACEDIRAEQE